MTMMVSTFGESKSTMVGKCCVTSNNNTSWMVGIDSKGTSQAGKGHTGFEKITRSTSSIKARMPGES
eukprot:8369349-Prorocentrum_lima.AAC.1